jgi:hypothetical protein
MKANPLKSTSSTLGLGATLSQPKPGDFPLGSPESRAAARAILIRRTALSPYDMDCYILCSCTSQLHGHADPDYSWMQKTEVYRRGREVSDEAYGPIIPSHLDPEHPRRTFASILFEGVHGRVPNPGDILTYEEVADLFSEEKVRAKVERIQGAWARRLPEYPCPFKCENGKMLIHQDDGSWQPDWDEDAATHWSDVEDEALERKRMRFLEAITSCPPTWATVVPERPAFPAVVFIESKDGVRRVKPLEMNTDSERFETRVAPPHAMP